MSGSRMRWLLASVAVLSIATMGSTCDLLEDSNINPSSSPESLTLPASFSGNGVLTMPVSSLGYGPIDCSATGTATVQIDASGHLTLSVSVTSVPAVGALGVCTTENGAPITRSATAEGVTRDVSFEFGGCEGRNYAPTGTGSFPGSGPDAAREIIVHVTCSNMTDPNGNYTLDAVAMK